MNRKWAIYACAGATAVLMQACAGGSSQAHVPGGLSHMYVYDDNTVSFNTSYAESRDMLAWTSRKDLILAFSIRGRYFNAKDISDITVSKVDGELGVNEVTVVLLSGDTVSAKIGPRDPGAGWYACNRERHCSAIYHLASGWNEWRYNLGGLIQGSYSGGINGTASDLVDDYRAIPNLDQKVTEIRFQSPSDNVSLQAQLAQRKEGGGTQSVPAQQSAGTPGATTAASPMPVQQGSAANSVAQHYAQAWAAKQATPAYISSNQLAEMARKCNKARQAGKSCQSVDEYLRTHPQSN